MTTSPPRVLIGDLCYIDEWDYYRPLPLNAGYIAAYLKQEQPDIPVEVFKDARKLFERVQRQPPEILALSHYDWNSNLDLAVLRRAKHARPDMVGVVGGPNFEADNPPWIREFFSNRPDIDVFITGEGEWSFHRLVELLRMHGGRVEDIPYADLPSSCYAFDRAAQRVIHNPDNPVARLDLRTVPSPYLTGLMDPFLADPQLAPIFETNRGCPYSCTFCCWGQATRSAVNQFPLQTVLDEIRYGCEHTKNPTGFMYLADGNFGILERDLEIASVIQECTAQLGRPERVFIYFAKNTNDRVVQIADTLNAVTSMSMSKQTLNPEVLSNIKRSNIPVAQYDGLRAECEKRGIDSFCELIYGLPGESYQSYVDGVVQTLRTGQRVTMYPHVMIHGAESSTVSDREQYGIETAFRVIPACVSTYPEIPSLEYEEMVIATDAMPHADYLRIRLFQFLYFVLGRQMFEEFGRALRWVDLEIATVADLVTKDEAQWPPLWTEVIREQRRGVENEFLSREELKLEFTAADLDTVKSDRGLPTLISSREALAELQTYLGGLIRRSFEGQLDEADLADLGTALDLSFDRIVCFEDPAPEKMASYDYDVDGWLTADPVRPLREFACDPPRSYRLQADERLLRLVEQSEKRLEDRTEALYRIRQSMLFGRSGDRLFTYERVPMQPSAMTAHLLVEEHRRTRETEERHSQIATR